MQDEFNEIIKRLSEDAHFALQKADYHSKRYAKGNMSTEHLLMGILDQETSTGAHFLIDEGITLDRVERYLGEEPKDIHGSMMSMMSLSEAVVLTLRAAANFSDEYGLEEIGTEQLLYAIISQPNARGTNIITSFGVDINRLAKTIEDYATKASEAAAARRKKAKMLDSQPKLKWLSRYGTNLTELAKNGKLDTVIGRDSEIERTITVLCRRTKSNPVLIGEAGVGKTAIVEGLASRIAKNDVPGILVGKRIYQVDLSSLVAGTKFRGEFEERIKGVIDEAVENPDIILFIDEIHLLTGTGSSENTMDAANILKPALARGQISLIGATTMDEYRKNIEKDHALARRFQTVIVEEPSPAVTLRILKGIKKHYESHHDVKIPDSILETAITMSRRYINDRSMPDKVIDIIDEACAIAKVAIDKKGGGKYKKLKIEQGNLTKKIEESAEAEDFEAAANYKTRLEQIKAEIKKLEKSGIGKQKMPSLTEDHLSRAVSLKTGIPVSKVHGSELELLSKLEQHIDKAIVGQDEAVHTVAKAIRRGRSGIASSARPIGSFLFMGPTGVGKTELARVVAREVFGGENSLIKIDMSEFGEKHNVSRLVGAPAGYVGYDDGGKLTEAVRRRPYSVVLFDEIEKAHPDVFNLLLQILEDGTLTDSHGNKVRFNNTVVILTSNLGAEAMYDEDNFGFSAKSKKDKKALAAEYEVQKSAAERALKKHMRPELINRLDSVLVFHALTEKQVGQIFDNMIEDLRKRLATKTMSIKISEPAKKWLIRIGFDPKNGARPLRRAIEDNVESLVSDAIITGKLSAGNIANVDLAKNKLKLSVGKE